MLRSLFTALLLLASTASLAAPAPLTVYTSRQAHMIEPILSLYSEQTGVAIQAVYVPRIGLEAMLQAEQEKGTGQGDLVLLNNVSRLTALVDLGLTQPINSPVMFGIPAQYRDPEHHWFGLTLRTRAIYTRKTEFGGVGAVALRMEDLAKPEFQGKVCMRSGSSPFNTGMIAQMIAANGEAATRQWLIDLKANLVRQPQGTDKKQIIAVAEGVCDYAVANSYYFGYMDKDDTERELAKRVHINFANQQDRGAHMNLSGAVVLNSAPNPEGAQAFIEYLASDAAQALYPALNDEYPIRAALAASELVASWGRFKPDSVMIADWAGFEADAQRLVADTGFDD
ncbi:extracellular solute-binding protein [Ferrimonas pelagia]|uniref:Fe(3+) ABC transporter substrate-binding protein n=1 Tax=Ferrimonas pelagia TaxID=1177826 RepID=A0ABP9FDK4_9GAMM